MIAFEPKQARAETWRLAIKLWEFQLASLHHSQQNLGTLDLQVPGQGPPVKYASQYEYLPLPGLANLGLVALGSLVIWYRKAASDGFECVSWEFDVVGKTLGQCSVWKLHLISRCHVYCK